ncbi:hypothetical protein CALVIDRAFT_370819 [Calocera viscosa TUFC12733]|uniref:Uncharacterized protein n=1 Tax=Calocera viscosa (strain TUFC12733) TaxID=1330018 RepID=A0A167GVA7_CALVF|nr:hypothetical protein CALVIDRAFT_370819 [Calocera viscosa TUFC12733]
MEMVPVSPFCKLLLPGDLFTEFWRCYWKKGALLRTVKKVPIEDYAPDLEDPAMHVEGDATDLEGVTTDVTGGTSEIERGVTDGEEGVAGVDERGTGSNVSNHAIALEHHPSFQAVFQYSHTLVRNEMMVASRALLDQFSDPPSAPATATSHKRKHSRSSWSTDDSTNDDEEDPLDDFPPAHPFVTEVDELISLFKAFIKTAFRRPDIWGAFIHTGEPGVGKSIWLTVMVLLARLHCQLPTVYYTGPNACYLFCEEGVFYIDEIAKQPPHMTIPLGNYLRSICAWLLLDVNENSPTLGCPEFFAKNIFVVQASSPREKHWDWAKKLGVMAKRHYMDVWSVAELLAGAAYQSPIRAWDRELIVTSCNEVGPSARAVYAIHSDKALDEKRLRIQDEIANLELPQLRKVIGLATDRAVSHSIIYIRPKKNRSEYQFAIPSRHIREQLSERCLNLFKMETDVEFQRFCSLPKTRPIGGAMLERYVQDAFDRAQMRMIQPLEQCSMKNRSMVGYRVSGKPRSSPNFLSIGLHGSKSAFRIVSTDEQPANVSVPRQIFNRRMSTMEAGMFYVPEADNQPTYDAVLTSMEETTGGEPIMHALLIQVTLAQTHDVKEEGIAWLQARGVSKFTYVVVTPHDTFTKISLSESVDKLIPDKYHLEIKTLHDRF